MGGWVDECKSRFKDCYCNQKRNYECYLKLMKSRERNRCNRRQIPTVRKAFEILTRNNSINFTKLVICYFFKSNPQLLQLIYTNDKIFVWEIFLIVILRHEAQKVKLKKSEITNKVNV